MAPDSITWDKSVPFTDLKRYVRVRQVVDDKFIEFDFAIGDPALYVELALPRAAFEVFCKHNRVEMMTDEQAAAVDADMEKWRYGDDRPNPRNSRQQESQ